MALKNFIMMGINFECSKRAWVCPCHCNSTEEGSMGCKQQEKVSKVFIGRNFSSILKPIFSLAEAAENPKIFYLNSPWHQSIHKQEKMGWVCLCVHVHSRIEQFKLILWKENNTYNHRLFNWFPIKCSLIKIMQWKPINSCFLMSLNWSLGCNL